MEESWRRRKGEGEELEEGQRVSLPAREEGGGSMIS